MPDNIPGPNPDWGILWTLREDPLDFIITAATLTEEELAKVRFTNKFLTAPAWGVSDSHTHRSECLLQPTERIRVPTPAKGTIPMKVFDGNGLLEWVRELTRLDWGKSQQQERDLYRMVQRQWAQHKKHLEAEPFMAAIDYLRAFAGLRALEENFPASKYTAKARAVLA